VLETKIPVLLIVVSDVVRVKPLIQS
jgi:hypothetical protein